VHRCPAGCRQTGRGEGGTAGWLAGGLGSLTCGSALCKTQGLQGGGKQCGRVSERENDGAQRPQRRQPAWEAPHHQRPAAVGATEPCKGQHPPAAALPFGSFIHPWGGCTWNRGRSGSSSCCYREGYKRQGHQSWQSASRVVQGCCRQSAAGSSRRRGPPATNPRPALTQLSAAPAARQGVPVRDAAPGWACGGGWGPRAHPPHPCLPAAARLSHPLPWLRHTPAPGDRRAVTLGDRLRWRKRGLTADSLFVAHGAGTAAVR
jgi:hypothetical protein